MIRSRILSRNTGSVFGLSLLRSCLRRDNNSNRSSQIQGLVMKDKGVGITILQTRRSQHVSLLGLFLLLFSPRSACSR